MSKHKKYDFPGDNNLIATDTQNLETEEKKSRNSKH
jgi:hypothetical protein